MQAVDIAYYNEPPEENPELESNAEEYQQLAWDWQLLWSHFDPTVVRKHFTPWPHIFANHVSDFLRRYGTLKWWACRAVEALHNPTKRDWHQKGIDNIPRAVAYTVACGCIDNHLKGNCEYPYEVQYACVA